MTARFSPPISPFLYRQNPRFLSQAIGLGNHGDKIFDAERILTKRRFHRENSGKEQGGGGDLKKDGYGEFV